MKHLKALNKIKKFSKALSIVKQSQKKNCEEASPGQKQDCLGWRRRLLIFERRKNFAARQKFTIGAQRGASSSKVLGDRYSRSQGDRYGSDRSEIPNSKFLGDRHDRSRNETFPTFLGDRAGSTENILDFKYQVGQQSVPEAVVCKTSPGFSGIGAEWFKRMKKSNTVLRLTTTGNHCITSLMALSVSKLFFKKFEICAMYNQWSMDDMEAYLSCSLTGEAAEVLWDLAGLGYQELVTKLENRYGTSGHEESYRYELQTLRRKPGESLRELSQTVKKLMSLAYPGEQSKLAVHLTTDFFLFALYDADLELKVREREPKNIDESLGIAQRLEVSKNLVNSSYRFTPQVRNMQDTTENRMKAVERQLNALHQSVDVIQDHKVQKRLGLLDSGSSVSIIPSSMVDVARVTPTKRSLKAANNTEIPMKGKMKLWIKVGGFSKLASVLVSDHVSEIILGLDWLVNNKVSWKYDEAQITVGNKNRVVKLVIKRLSERQLCRIYSSVEVQIPARAEIDVPTKLVVRQPSKLTLTDCVWSEARQDIFSDTGTEIGVAKGVYHKINTEQARPIKQQLRLLNRSLVAHQLARERLKTGTLYRKSLYDAKVKVLTLRPGDKVWYLYPRSWQGKSPKWVSPYIVDHLIPPVNAAIKKTSELNRRMKQYSKCGRRMLTRNHKRHFDRCSGAGNSASDSQLVSLGRAIPYLGNSTPEKAVNALKLSFPGIPSTLTLSFSLENCAEEPTQRKRWASEARRWANQFIAFEMPDEAHQETSLGSVPMSSHVEVAGESLVDTPCSTARPSLVDWILEGQVYEGETSFPVDQVLTISTPAWAKEDSDILPASSPAVPNKKGRKRPSRWGPELMAINVSSFDEEL
ncbi:hypothetical protein HELRODRAFT_160141 [Helobdella robusta]|uniref:Uncharacterized protein n=1 Tax=Helobdella robusta TaxID=6412 RepID=T1EPV5_HELRO|nr:hypothetical protein HELRODRAFT_160141 [Helobdella robusta]ESO06028.1 hypothetical protein HELRODRAFT_160141 [Helobdella robusta]